MAGCLAWLLEICLIPSQSCHSFARGSFFPSMLLYRSFYLFQTSIRYQYLAFQIHLRAHFHNLSWCFPEVGSMTYSMDASTSLTDLQVQADDSSAIVAGNGVELLSISGTLLGLASFVVLLRCWARQVMLRTFGWDDAAMILALCMAILGFVFFVKLVQAGDGKQANLLSASAQQEFKFSEVMIGVCCVVGICLVKISVGFFLLRFLQTRSLKRLVVGFIAFIFVYMIYSIFTFVLMCRPTNSYWDDSVPGTCWSAATLTVVGNLNAGT
ncbi:hypothetical protein BD289DRAFT_215986 [Coniella lustricola]|uniref:Rhodopsin domain-containing protein n=1 Tax=Coniella lustricola TaxID=2025994 RepID=A0A2T3AB81_9PEZI|nr:hypothetical protein BD289DRAFT_215986 [Coniella lustricola]